MLQAPPHLRSRCAPPCANIWGAASLLCASAGRHKALASLGLHVEKFQQEGIFMALSDLSLSYKAPLRAGDTFYVTSAIAQVRDSC